MRLTIVLRRGRLLARCPQRIKLSETYVVRILTCAFIRNVTTRKARGNPLISLRIYDFSQPITPTPIRRCDRGKPTKAPKPFLSTGQNRKRT